MKKITLLSIFLLFSSVVIAQNVTLSVSKNSISELESATITATLSAPTDKDVIINLKSTGTAVYEVDYSANFASKGITTVAGGNGSGSASNQLNNAMDVSVDASGNIYICDYSNNRVQKWAPGATSGITIASGLNSPFGIHVDSSGNVYISDNYNNRIQKYTPGATIGVTVAGGNGAGDASNQLNRPMGIYVDAAGDMYVSDSYFNHRIQKWVSGATTGTTVAGGNGYGTASNQLYQPMGIHVDASGNMYISDSSNNRIQKWAPGATTGITVAGGIGQGSLNRPTDVYVDASGYMYICEASSSRISKWAPGASSGITIASGALSNPYSIYVDSSGNIYIADSFNHRIQKNQIAPQIIIKSGEITGQLTITGIADTSDEDDETIVLEVSSVTNAVLTTTTPITITITDVNDPPVATFTLSQPKIVENSATDVTLTATLSAVSGKNVTIEFELLGTATEITEYSVSSKIITIPAGQNKGTIIIVTKGLDDTLVEVLETIIFKVKTLTNVTTTIESVTLLLESDDNPNVTLTSSKTTIAEHESSVITATLSAPSSKDVVINLKSTGTALLDLDYNSNTKFEISTVAGGNGLGDSANQFHYPENVFVDKDGNIFVADHNNHRIQKWLPGATSGITVAGGNGWGSANNQFNRPQGLFIDTEGNIFVADVGNNRIQKWTQAATTGVTVAGGNGEGNASNQLNMPTGVYLDNSGNIYVAEFANHRVQKWAPSATSGVTVAGGNGQGSAANQFYYAVSVTVDSKGNIYVADYFNNRVQKWLPGATSGITVAGGNGQGSAANQLFNPRNIFIDSNDIIYVADLYNHRIQRLRPGTTTGVTVLGGNGPGAAMNQLLNPSAVFVDKNGFIYVTDSGNNRIQKINTNPQILIKAGETTGQLTISGIEDELNNEGIETIILKVTSIQNATVSGTDEITINLLDNSKTLELLPNEPFIGLSEGAVAWGDYDNDGDQDVAIMGKSASGGAITALYENKNGSFVNTNQNFANLYGGDISWVDINKDGKIDLVILGYSDNPYTKVYLNKGLFFEPTDDYGLPQLAFGKMAWGDLDNDGDIDLAISGIDKDEKFIFNVYYKEDTKERFIVEPNSLNWPGFYNGDLKIADIDLDGDNDIIYGGQSQSGTVGSVIYNSYIRTANPSFNINLALKNSSIEVARIKESPTPNFTIISSGINAQGTAVLSTNYTLNVLDTAGAGSQFPKLKDGDIAVGDYTNNGRYDIVFTGEDNLGNPVTKLYIQDLNGNFKDSGITLKGLRKSTAHWVDYDMDGDLDLFLTGIDVLGGAKTYLYKSEIANKKNVAPAKITGLKTEDLGNGKVRFSWDKPSDDYSNELGYVLRLGTKTGGTEFSNTESDLTTGRRLITKPAAIYTNFFETQLHPSTYFWSVQAVDTGLKGGQFSEESSFALTYEWKILNQGGIIDRTIYGLKDPVLKLADIDNDNDLDLVYGSATSYGVQLYKYDGKRLIQENNHPMQYLQNITSAETGDINGDGKADILINHFNGSSYNLNLYVSNASSYTTVNVGEGLFKAKSRMVDLNNDGQVEITIVGMSSSLPTANLKFLVYEFNKNSNPMTFKKTDISSQIEPLKNPTFDLGDIDKEQDIDFIISGFHATRGLESYIYNNTTVLGSDFTLTKTSNNLVAVADGTTNLIDFDSDGDLDAVFTGTNKQAIDVFEIYLNQYDEGKSNWPRFDIGLPPIRNAKIDLGDFNGDGYSDLLYSGTIQGQGFITKLSEFSPSTKKYINSTFDVSDIVNAEVEFGDLDGDGDLDFILTGENVARNGYIFRTYINVRNESAQVLAQSGGRVALIEGKGSKSAAVTYTVNKPPAVPVISKVEVLKGVASKPGLIPVELSWLASNDDHTPIAGLSYAIKIGTTPNGEEIMSANANTNGIRKSSEKGNAEHSLKWRVSIPAGIYYWSVQAIDAAYAGSNFTTTNKFTVTAETISTDSDGDGVDDALDLCPNTPVGAQVNANGCAQSQLDDDKDGVMNDKDLCPNTPVGATVDSNGCSTGQLDDDKDGVPNSLDLCPNTLAGATININGCAQSQLDDDKDGVMNDKDLCINTLIGATVDTNGCSIGQLDDDKDSVPNNLDQCPNTPIGTPVDYKGCPTISTNNFKLEIFNPTCQTKTNGKIKITGTASYNYTATMDGKEYTFTNNILEVLDLAPKVYTICIKVPALNNYTQCFDFEVKAAPGLGARTTMNTKGNRTTANIEIESGTAPYLIEVNGKTVQITYDKSVSVSVQNRDLLVVKSSVACEGSVSERVILLNELTAYPNPTSDFVEVFIPTTYQKSSVMVQVINNIGKTVLHKEYKINGNKIVIPMEQLSTGLYMINVQLEKPQTIKVIKK